MHALRFGSSTGSPPPFPGFFRNDKTLEVEVDLDGVSAGRIYALPNALASG
jgi:hypothetical protein